MAEIRLKLVMHPDGNGDGWDDITKVTKVITFHPEGKWHKRKSGDQSN